MCGSEITVINNCGKLHYVGHAICANLLAKSGQRPHDVNDDVHAFQSRILVQKFGGAYGL